jgi:hypothetical protein
MTSLRCRPRTYLHKDEVTTIRIVSMAEVRQHRYFRRGTARQRPPPPPQSVTAIDRQSIRFVARSARNGARYVRGGGSGLIPGFPA